mmetsp:Transcript_40346/g.58967  ORF Transcript_40346/g.58967 Transcript_40346/m.58967 type:complete len:348 (-) Transcript_40346:78-1121(-)
MRLLHFYISSLLLCHSKIRNQQRWDAALETLKTTEPSRCKSDRRAKLAALVGIYMDDDDPRTSFGVDLIVAVQPDRSSARKLLFMNRLNGALLGFVLLETSTTDDDDDDDVKEQRKKGYVSTFRGIEVTTDARGRGLSTLFISVWLKLCLQADVTPATVSINKPLLALTFVRFGFTPKIKSTTTIETFGTTRKRKRISVRKTPIQIEVNKGKTGGEAHIYSSPHDFENLQAGFTQTELRTQKLVLSDTPSNPRGKVIQIRTHYFPPQSYKEETVLYGLRLDALQEKCGRQSSSSFGDDDDDGGSSIPDDDDDEWVSDKVSKILIGPLRGFKEEKEMAAQRESVQKNE